MPTWEGCLLAACVNQKSAAAFSLHRPLLQAGKACLQCVGFAGETKCKNHLLFYMIVIIIRVSVLQRSFASTISSGTYGLQATWFVAIFTSPHRHTPSPVPVNGDGTVVHANACPVFFEPKEACDESATTFAYGRTGAAPGSGGLLLVRQFLKRCIGCGKMRFSDGENRARKYFRKNFQNHLLFLLIVIIIRISVLQEASAQQAFNKTRSFE